MSSLNMSENIMKVDVDACKDATPYFICSE